MTILSTVVKPYLLSITAQRKGPAVENTGPVNLLSRPASEPVNPINLGKRGKFLFA